MKKRNNFFRSLRFRILVILIILGIVPGVIVTYTMLHNYQDRAVSMLTETVRSQCEILSNLIIKENYLNDTSSETVNSKLEMFSNIYNGRVLLADRDFKIVGDTFHTEEGKSLLSPLAVACVKGEKADNFEFQKQDSGSSSSCTESGCSAASGCDAGNSFHNGHCTDTG